MSTYVKDFKELQSFREPRETRKYVNTKYDLCVKQYVSLGFTWRNSLPWSVSDSYTRRIYRPKEEVGLSQQIQRPTERINSSFFDRFARHRAA